MDFDISGLCSSLDRLSLNVPILLSLDTDLRNIMIRDASGRIVIDGSCRLVP